MIQKHELANVHNQTHTHTHTHTHARAHTHTQTRVTVFFFYCCFVTSVLTVAQYTSILNKWWSRSFHREPSSSHSAAYALPVWRAASLSQHIIPNDHWMTSGLPLHASTKEAFSPIPLYMEAPSPRTTLSISRRCFFICYSFFQSLTSVFLNSSHIFKTLNTISTTSVLCGHTIHTFHVVFTQYAVSEHIYIMLTFS